MFRVIKKTEYWDALDAMPTIRGSNGLKHTQDSVVLHRLFGLQGATICEAGGGNSRILENLCKHNECWNLDKMEGVGNGPTRNLNDSRIRLVRDYLGAYSKALPADYFDYVVSISVVEHVPLKMLDAFFEDGLRLLKPGGIMLHAVDVYLPDRDDTQNNRAYQKRLRAYIEAVERLFPRAQWLESPETDEELYASARFASNTDVVLFAWNKHGPLMTEVRATSQSCSLAIGVIKQPAQ